MQKWKSDKSAKCINTFFAVCGQIQLPIVQIYFKIHIIYTYTHTHIYEMQQKFIKQKTEHFIVITV